MTDAAAAVLAPWSSFYVMVGSSAAALTGLMFVVITLVTGERLRQNQGGLSAFSTPTVAHFGAALFVAGVLVAPWRTLVHPAVLLGLAGFCGVVYLFRVMHLTRRLSTYRADIEDWAWYTILPFAAYGAILAGAILLPRIPVEALFTLAGGSALLIFIAIGDPNQPPSSG